MSWTENIKRECTISLQESELFTCHKMEGKTFSKRIVALYLKEKNMDVQHKGTTLKNSTKIEVE